MIDVKQIFESVILGEALGNLNNIPNARAKKVIATLLKDKQTRMFAEVSPNSTVDKIGSYRDISSFNSELKKYTALGHRVGAIVFIPDDGRGIVTVITDERYTQDGAVRNDLKVRSSDSSTGYGRYGNETTLGKVYSGYFNANLKESDNVEVYAILKDPTLVGKVQGRKDNKTNTDPYQPFGKDSARTPGQTPFMYNALRTAAENKLIDVDRMDVIQAVVEFHNLNMKYKNDFRARTNVKVGGKIYQIRPKSIWMSHSTGALKDLALHGTPFPICSMEIVDEDGATGDMLYLNFDKNLKITSRVS